MTDEGETENEAPREQACTGAEPRMCRQAVASMALGLLSFIPGVGLLAFILGGDARRRIADSGGLLTGDDMARAGVCLGGWATIAFLVLGCLFGLTAATRTTASPHGGCRSNLKQIGLGLALYQSDNSDEMPPSFQTLVEEGYAKDVHVFTCAAARLHNTQSEDMRQPELDGSDVDRTGDYVYARLITPPLRPIPVAWDRVVHFDNGISVLYSDAHVALRKPSELATQTSANVSLYAALPFVPVETPVKRDWAWIALLVTLAFCACLALWPVTARLVRTLREAFP